MGLAGISLVSLPTRCSRRSGETDLSRPVAVPFEAAVVPLATPYPATGCFKLRAADLGLSFRTRSQVELNENHAQVGGVCVCAGVPLQTSLPACAESSPLVMLL